MSVINFEEFRLVAPKENRLHSLSLSVMWDGRIHLNGKLLEKIGSPYIFLRVNSDGTQILIEPLGEKQNQALSVPKSGDIRVTELHKDLEALGLRFPVYYTVTWDENFNIWHGIYNPDKTLPTTKNKQKKLSQPRKNGLKDMLA